MTTRPDPMPLPSHIHYELLLQLLERQSLFAADPQSPQRQQINELIITLRKALSQQKYLESLCARSQQDVDYRWSLNEKDAPFPE